MGAGDHQAVFAERLRHPGGELPRVECVDGHPTGLGLQQVFDRKHVRKGSPTCHEIDVGETVLGLHSLDGAGELSFDRIDTVPVDVGRHVILIRC